MESCHWPVFMGIISAHIPLARTQSHDSTQLPRMMGTTIWARAFASNDILYPGKKHEPVKTKTSLCPIRGNAGWLTASYMDNSSLWVWAGVRLLYLSPNVSKRKIFLLLLFLPLLISYPKVSGETGQVLLVKFYNWKICRLEKMRFNI
jgi:hypothetical protein